MLEEGKKTNNAIRPSVYLETNILQGLFSRRNTEDIMLIEKARKSAWECYTSIYTLMELLDISKDRKFFNKVVMEKWGDVNTFLRDRRTKDLNATELKDVSDELNNFFEAYKIIEFINIKEEDWELVKEIGESSNLHSSDIIHLVTAYVGHCHILVTHDQQLIKEGNMILNQERVYDRLRICDTIDAEKTLSEVISNLSV